MAGRGRARPRLTRRQDALDAEVAWLDHEPDVHISAARRAGVDHWACSGEHIINKGAGTHDSETCLITGDTTGYSQMLGTFSGAPFADLPLFGPVPWFSDYNGAMASTWTITFKDDGYLDRDGFETFEADITAFYNS